MNGTTEEIKEKNGDTLREHSHKEDVPSQHSRADLLTLEVVTKPDGKKIRKEKGRKTTVIIIVTSILAVFSLSIAGAVTAAVLLTQDDTKRASNSSSSMATGVCRTSGCTTLANLLQRNLDETVDPCDHFYTFACGGWLNRTSLPTGAITYSQPNVYGRNSTLQIHSILESDGADIKAVEKVKALYQLCMDTEAINQTGVEPLLALIESTGGWNLVDGTRSGEWSVNSTHFIQNKLYRSRALFEVSVGIDEKNSSKYIIKIRQGSLLSQYGPPQAFKPYFEKVMSLVNSTVPSKTYQKVADEILDLDRKLSAIHVSVGYADVNARYNKKALRELSSLWPDFDWVGSLQYLFSLHNVSIDENDTVIVETPTYFQNLSAIFCNTSMETLENYVKWHLVSFFIEYLSYPFVDALYNYQGRSKPERFDNCYILVQRAFPIAIARQYIQDIYPVNSKTKTAYIVNRIIEAFRKRLEVLEWLDDSTKKLALEKVNNIGKKIAYPDQLFNDTYLNSLSSDIVIYENYMRTVAEARRALISRELRKLGQVVNSEAWTNSPTTSNAFYNPSLNEITVTAVFTLPPNLGEEWPDYYNFGALGTIIGHEVTHGFDNLGQQYDPNGNFRQWWSPTAVEKFRTKQTCILEQYSKYEFLSYQTKPWTLGENIADNGGLQTSYQAYQSMVLEKNQPQLALPGLRYTPEQIFFIAQAQTLCTLYLPQAVESILKYPHSPAPYRVIGPMSNSEDFSRAFKCPLGAPMNPPDKCVIW